MASALCVALPTFAVSACAPPWSPTQIVFRVINLPAGSVGKATLTGPGGFTRAVTRTQTFTQLSPGHYVISADPVPQPGQSYYAVTPRQDVNLSAGQTETRSVDYYDILPDTTKTIATANGLDLAPGSGAPDSPSVTFRGDAPAVPSLVVGNILAGGVGPDSPHGFLRKVTSVQPVPEGLTVTTTDATIMQALPRGRIDISVQLKPGPQPTAAGPSAIFPMRLAAATTPVPNVQTGAQVNAQLSFGNGCNQVAGTLGGPYGNLSIAPRLDFKADWSLFGGIHSALVEFDMSQRLELGVKSPGVELTCAAEIEQQVADFEPIVFLVGPIPVVIITAVLFRAGAQAGGGVSDDYKFSEGVDLKVGGRCDNGCGALRDYHGIGQFAWNPNPGFDHGKALEAQAKLYAGPKLEADLYGIAGPYVGVDGFLQLKSSGTSASDETVSAGLSGYAGFDLAKLGLPGKFELPDLLTVEYVLLRASAPIPSGPVPTPSVGLTLPSPQVIHYYLRASDAAQAAVNDYLARLNQTQPAWCQEVQSAPLTEKAGQDAAYVSTDVNLHSTDPNQFCGGGFLLVDYVVKDTAGWRYFDSMGAQSQGPPMLGPWTAQGAPCVPLRDSPGSTMPTHGCMSNGVLDGGPTYLDGNLWWHVASQGWVEHAALSCPYKTAIGQSC